MCCNSCLDEPETPTPSEEVKSIVEAETPTEEKEKALGEEEDVKDDWEIESDEEEKKEEGMVCREMRRKEKVYYLWG